MEMLFLSVAEPNHLRRFGVTISPEQLAEDFKKLRGLLSTIPGVHNFLVGPDVTQPRGNAMGYLQRWEILKSTALNFLKNGIAIAKSNDFANLLFSDQQLLLPWKIKNELALEADSGLVPRPSTTKWLHFSCGYTVRSGY